MTAVTLMVTLSRVMTSWGGDGERDDAQIDVDHARDERRDQEKPGALCSDQPPQHEDHTPLILLHHANRREGYDEKKKHERANDNRYQCIHSEPPCGFPHWSGEKPSAPTVDAASLSGAPPSSSHRSNASAT